MFRFIHTADLHLDAPLHSLALKDEALSDLVGSATRAAFGRIVNLCLDENVHALIIAGDLYDRDLHSMKTAAFLTTQLERLNTAEIAVFIIRGNHDAASVITKELDLPPNVRVFSGHGDSKRFEEHGIAIHGVSFSKPHAPESLLPRYPAPVPGYFNIGLLHTSLAGSEGHDTYAPCSVSDLVNHGYDYWALGHIHKRQIHSSEPFIVMPGMPQGRDIGEAGTKSVTLVTVSDGKATIEERHTSQVEFRRLTCALDGVGAWRDMLEMIILEMRALVSELQVENEPARKCILRIELTGQTPLAWRARRDMDLLNEQIKEAADGIGLAWVEKIECHLRQPEALEQREDPRFELHEIMKSLSQDQAMQARALKLTEVLVAELPPEVRSVFGADQAALATQVAGFLGEGCDEVVALMMSENAGEDT